MKFVESNLVDETHDNLIFSYNDQCNSGVFQRENSDLKSDQARALYDNYIKQICTSNAQEFLKKDFSPKKHDDIFHKFTEIILYLFEYNHDLLRELNDFFNRLIIHETEYTMDGICLEAKNINDPNNRLYYIQVPPMSDESSIVCLVHEFIHYHCLINNVSINKKKYYEEILSIYGEKLTIYLLDKYSLRKRMTHKIENVRLEAIKWHYVDRIEEVKQLKQLYQFLCMMKKYDPKADNSKKEIEKDFPWITSQKGIQIFDEYEKMTRESYGIGYLYAENLFQRFLDDKKQLLKIQSVLKKESSLQSLLDYYGIQANNPNIYIPVEKKIKKLTI